MVKMIVVMTQMKHNVQPYHQMQIAATMNTNVAQNNVYQNHSNVINIQIVWMVLMKLVVDHQL